MGASASPSSRLATAAGSGRASDATAVFACPAGRRDFASGGPRTSAGGRRRCGCAAGRRSSSARGRRAEPSLAAPCGRCRAHAGRSRSAPACRRPRVPGAPASQSGAARDATQQDRVLCQIFERRGVAIAFDLEGAGAVTQCRTGSVCWPGSRGGRRRQPRLTAAVAATQASAPHHRHVLQSSDRFNRSMPGYGERPTCQRR